jgi:hypothetical protein
MDQNATPARTAELEWQGKLYTLHYQFNLIRRIRAAGIGVPELFRAINANPMVAAERSDEICSVVGILLRDAGAPVSDEEVFRAALADGGFTRTCMALFMWLCTVHFYQSPNLPEKKTEQPSQ